MIENIAELTLDEIENIEKLSMRWLYQSVLDFGFESYVIFYHSPDDVKDVAEDVTREILDRLPGFNIQQRIFGTVDYKKARYVILPHEIVRQAIFVDSKAEKDSDRTATLQKSQTSMIIKQIRNGQAVEVQGLLPSIYTHNNMQFLTSTLLLHYFYIDDETSGRHILQHITLCCIPNGLLQNRYNPTPNDSFWRAGRNAPTRNEEFRVRVSFNDLQQKANWRVQRIKFLPESKSVSSIWND
ncbi:MAG: BglI family type II restriction endonuclease [Firmicutes bacterium]|nr:BglI family type II restriction endonuclease [Bacillota bacterium]